jgi:hypothetical protein
VGNVEGGKDMSRKPAGLLFFVFFFVFFCIFCPELPNSFFFSFRMLGPTHIHISSQPRPDAVAFPSALHYAPVVG